MNFIKSRLHNSVDELIQCVDETRQAIIESEEPNRDVISRLDTYDEAIEKIVNEVDKIDKLHTKEDHLELNHICNKISELSNMIKNDAMDLILTIGTGFTAYPDEDLWN